MSIRVLYLDDDLALARLVEKSFARQGLDMVHVHDSEEAIALLAKEPFDAVVLDHYLTNMTGHEVLRQLHELQISVPVVYVTGSNEAKVAIEALKNGAADYVIKSVSEDFLPLLAEAVLQTVANARLRHAKEQADEEIRRAKERAEALLAEMNHRVANSLALVAGLLRLQASSTDNEEVKLELKETQGRIAAIAGMHRSLYSNEKVTHVDMEPYITSLARDMATTLGARNSSCDIIVDVDRMELPADRAVSAGMIITELVTNALKYAYPDDRKGEIRIILKQHDESRARLVVEDDGVGINGASSGIKSTRLGSKIVKTMADSLGEGIQYPETGRGTVAEVIVPLTAGR